MGPVLRSPATFTASSATILLRPSERMKKMSALADFKLILRVLSPSTSSLLNESKEIDPIGEIVI